MVFTVTIEINSQGETILKNEEYAITLNSLIKEATIYDAYSQFNMLNTLMDLMSFGMSARGLKLYLKGKLDDKKTLQNYCREALLPYKDIQTIIQPI